MAKPIILLFTFLLLALAVLMGCANKSKPETLPNIVEAQPAPQNANSLKDTRDGKTYKTVKIGEQVWMAENLNYEAEGSRCYDDKPANCEKYGRLYNWNTALKVCPKGWHLPSEAEWETLKVSVGGASGGEHLKTNDWGGLDTYGFSALPGGWGFSDGHFYDVGKQGSWWSSSEISTNNAYNLSIVSSYIYIYPGDNIKDVLFSVRCLKD